RVPSGAPGGHPPGPRWTSGRRRCTWACGRSSRPRPPASGMS
ncbi:unnamed protein product, partial [Heterosigma akashiwo]